MVKMYLRPSDIYFSQDSVNNVFDKQCVFSYKPIGYTLDALCEGRCEITDIPTIRVIRLDGKWVSADNRRLWVFREMERLGKCDYIPVHKVFYIPSNKLTSNNGGVSVQVRGNPGGIWHNKLIARKLIHGIKTSTVEEFQSGTTVDKPNVISVLNAYTSTAIFKIMPGKRIHYGLDNVPSYAACILNHQPSVGQSNSSLRQGHVTRTFSLIPISSTSNPNSEILVDMSSIPARKERI